MVEDIDQFELVNVSSPFAFDQSSVMLYCSMCSSSSQSIPAMVFKDGTQFGTAQRLSTVDILEVQVIIDQLYLVKSNSVQLLQRKLPRSRTYALWRG